MDGLVRSLSIGLDWDIDNRGLVKANEETDGLVDNTENAEDSMDGLGNAGENTGGAISNAFESATETITSGLETLSEYKTQLSLIATVGAGAILGFSSMAGDIEESINTITREFGDAHEQAINFAYAYADSTELSRKTTLDWTKTLGLNLRMLDLSSQETADLTAEVVQMSHDFSHFMDMSPEQAFNSLHQAIRGGRFPRALRDITGQVRQSDIENRALTMGLIEQGEEMTQQAERIATLSMLQEELSITAGAAEAGQSELNTKMIEFKNNIRDVSIAIGNSFLPSTKEGYDAINNFTNALIESEWTRPISRVLALGTAFSGLAAGIGIVYALAGVIGIGAAPLAGIILGVGALILIIEDLWTSFQGGESVIFNIIDWFGEITGQSDTLGNAIDWLGDQFGIMKEDLSLLADGFTETFAGFGEFIVGIFTFDKEKIVSGFTDIIEGWQQGWDGFDGFLDELSNALLEGFIKLDGYITSLVIDFAFDLTSNLLNSLLFGFEMGWNNFVDWIKEKTGLELPKLDIPEIDLQEVVEKAWNELTSWWNSLEILNIDFSILNIKKAVTNKWNDYVNWWRNLEILDVDFNVPDIKSLIEQEWNELTDWWEGLDLGFDFDFDLMKSINEQLNKLPDWAKKLLNIEDEVIEKESKEIQNNNSKNIKRWKINENIEINVDGSKSPEEVAKMIERKLKTRERVLGGEVGM